MDHTTTRRREGMAGENPATAVSAHFTVGELTRTDTGIRNDPTPEALAELTRLAQAILEPARDIVGPLKVNSGYRSPAVNKAVGGVKTSQHMRGQAADVVPMSMQLGIAFLALQASDIPFDQLILEPTWIHISVAPANKKPRRQCLRAHMEGGRMVYQEAK